ncbi:hypothetical protein OIK40_14065 [Erythrobacter sp. sf7]|uniref:Uncharacterized protein n=1 Tax=Erythrobacter fulvus TaxID=2987523 RepID=A0ABT5JUN9_9SPHN|nr:hypothetical protein [Erythrobacter fulvus]MDC8755771.1 hypothetical protein [Erythrobacter fulvus]
MKDPFEFQPGYVSPLTDKEHATIGRIAILWGQIENSVDDLLPHISGLTVAQLEALQLFGKPMNQKITFLKSSAKAFPHEPYKSQIIVLCTLVDETKSSRNHVFHGMWGWRGDEKTKRVFPAARKGENPEAPFPASKLPALEKKLCKCARLGHDLVCTLVLGQLERHRQSRFFHHGAEGDVPEWLLQWSQRNPWPHDDPDQISPIGQLPRRPSLYPER